MFFSRLGDVIRDLRAGDVPRSGAGAGAGSGAAGPGGAAGRPVRAKPSRGPAKAVMKWPLKGRKSLSQNQACVWVDVMRALVGALVPVVAGALGAADAEPGAEVEGGAGEVEGGAGVETEVEGGAGDPLGRLLGTVRCILRRLFRRGGDFDRVLVTFDVETSKLVRSTLFELLSMMGNPDAAVHRMRSQCEELVLLGAFLLATTGALDPWARAGQLLCLCMTGIDRAEVAVAKMVSGAGGHSWLFQDRALEVLLWCTRELALAPLGFLTMAQVVDNLFHTRAFLLDMASLDASASGSQLQKELVRDADVHVRTVLVRVMAVTDPGRETQLCLHVLLICRSMLEACMRADGLFYGSMPHLCEVVNFMLDMMPRLPLTMDCGGEFETEAGVKMCACGVPSPDTHVHDLRVCRPMVVVHMGEALLTMAIDSDGYGAGSDGCSADDEEGDGEEDGDGAQSVSADSTVGTLRRAVEVVWELLTDTTSSIYSARKLLVPWLCTMLLQVQGLLGTADVSVYGNPRVVANAVFNSLPDIRCDGEWGMGPRPKQALVSFFHALAGHVDDLFLEPDVLWTYAVCAISAVAVSMGAPPAPPCVFLEPEVVQAALGSTALVREVIRRFIFHPDLLKQASKGAASPWSPEQARPPAVVLPARIIAPSGLAALLRLPCVHRELRDASWSAMADCVTEVSATVPLDKYAVMNGLDFLLAVVDPCDETQATVWAALSAALSPDIRNMYAVWLRVHEIRLHVADSADWSFWVDTIARRRAGFEFAVETLALTYDTTAVVEALAGTPVPDGDPGCTRDVQDPTAVFVRTVLNLNICATRCVVTGLYRKLAEARPEVFVASAPKPLLLKLLSASLLRGGDSVGFRAREVWRALVPFVSKEWLRLVRHRHAVAPTPGDPEAALASLVPDVDARLQHMSAADVAFVLGSTLGPDASSGTVSVSAADAGDDMPSLVALGSASGGAHVPCAGSEDSVD